MYAVVAVSGTLKWISGIFQSKDAVDAYLAAIPDAVRPRHDVRELPDLSYPFFIVEDEQGFHFLTEAEAIAKVLSCAEARHESEDGCYATLYRITSDWRPPRAGSDYVGALPHQHVTDEMIEDVRVEGFVEMWG